MKDRHKLWLFAGGFILLATVTISGATLFNAKNPGLYCDNNLSVCIDNSTIYLNDSYISILTGSITGNGNTSYLAIWNNNTDLGASPIYYDNGRVGIFDSTPDAQLDININDTANIGLIVQHEAGQTANMSEWRENTGYIYFAINNTGGGRINQDWTIGYKDTNGDGIPDAPSTLLFDPPDDGVNTYQSPIAELQSKTGLNSSAPTFQSKDGLESTHMRFNSRVDAGTCSGIVGCGRTFCSISRCGNGCTSSHFGCSGSFQNVRCIVTTSCDAQHTQTNCENIRGCTWTPGIVTAYADIFSTDNTLATLLATDNTDAKIYTNDMGSLHILMNGSSGNSDNVLTDPGLFQLGYGIEDTGPATFFHFALDYFYYDLGLGDSITLDNSGLFLAGYNGGVIIDGYAAYNGDELCTATNGLCLPVVAATGANNGTAICLDSGGLWCPCGSCA